MQKTSFSHDGTHLFITQDKQLLLLKYREDIISAKVDEEQTLETLSSKILFLKMMFKFLNVMFSKKHQGIKSYSKINTSFSNNGGDLGLVFHY